jgi:GntR family transcriptional regulator, carbon starvation induced regulator
MAHSIPSQAASSRAFGIGESPSKASYVLHRIRIDILSAVFKPGEKLGFSALTSRYQVGLSPIREALSQLVGSGLVTLESQRGFRVAPVSHEDLADVAASRCHLEIFALGLSIEHGDEPWRMRVRQAVDQFVHIAAKVGDQRPINEDWQDIHRNVHFALISACGSPILLQFCSQIYDRFDRYRRLSIPSQSFMAGTAGDHQKIADAALGGENDKAKALLKRHIEDIADVVITNFSTIVENGISTPAAKNH